MNIIYSEMVGYERKQKTGLGFELFEKYIFEGEQLYKIKQFLKDNFKVYQYDDNVKYSEHDLFYWSNSERYFDITVNTNKVNEEQSKTIYNTILKALENEFKEYNISVYIKKGFALEPEKIEQFILNYEIDLNNLQLDKFNVIKLDSVSFPNISVEAKRRYYELNKQFLENVNGKKAIINNQLEGTFKQIGETIGFFKKRVRKEYYNITLTNLKSIQFI